MKQLKIVAVAVLVLATFGLKAADPGSKELRVQVIAKADQTFKVIYEAEEKSKVKVNIYDWKNHKIFTDVIDQTDGFSKPYNFKNLPEGNYTFEIISNGVKSREVVSNSIQAPEHTMKALIIPTANSGKFQLMVMSNDMGPVRISVLDHKGKLLLEEDVNSPETFGKVYDLNQLRNSQARFVVTAASGVLKDQSFNW
ncbi:MAG: hypothetical protein OER04_19165 [Cyclobacteriaceae bacterium]|nr:hypothetical protein [Cyclobacteriaceae bacterium]